MSELAEEPYTSVLKRYSSGEQKTIKSYVEYLQENDLAFFTGKPKHFPKIEMDYNLPFEVHDIIIELSPKFPILEVMKEITTLGVQYIEIRIGMGNWNIIETFLSQISKTRVRSVSIMMAYEPNKTNIYKQLILLIDKFPFITDIKLHSVDIKKVDNLRKLYNGTRISAFEDNLSNEKCGAIDPQFFTINLPFYTESLQFNTCLHKKISIDKNGDVKNCLSLKKVYGNINSTSLLDIIQLDSFQFLGKIKKDDVAVCKDCEFRYICSDCRAYVNNPYDKPLKCNYNPYTNEYEN